MNSNNVNFHNFVYTMKTADYGHIISYKPNIILLIGYKYILYISSATLFQYIKYSSGYVSLQILKKYFKTWDSSDKPLFHSMRKFL